MSSISVTCDIFATLTPDIVTCPSCRLEQLLLVRNVYLSALKDLCFVKF